MNTKFWISTQNPIKLKNYSQDWFVALSPSVHEIPLPILFSENVFDFVTKEVAGKKLRGLRDDTMEILATLGNVTY